MLNDNGLFPTPPGWHYSWRAVRRGDDLALNKFLLEIEDHDQRGWVDSLADRQRDFNDPDTDPKTDSLLAIDAHGEIAALAWIFAPKEYDAQQIAFLWLEVHPRHREGDLGNFMLSWMEARARQIFAIRPQEPARYLRMEIPEKLAYGVTLYRKHGFREVRAFYRMRRDLKEPLPELILPQGLHLISWQAEKDDAFRQVINDAFRDHWGNVPVSEDSWKLWISGHPHFQPEMSFLMTSGNEPVGAVVCRIRPEEQKRTGIKEGWVMDLGVRRDWRQKGIGSALLIKALVTFREHGLDYAGLGVDTENLTGALRIYKRIGFFEVKRFLTFSKQI